jgi:hypothetical protein
MTSDPSTGPSTPDNADAARVVAATGLDWDRIVGAFEAAGGAEASHTDLAAAVHPLIVGSGVGNPGWWGQGATVAYEKQIGRRVTGQSGAGDFQVSATRTVRATTGRGELRDAAGAAVTASGSVTVVDQPRVSDTPKRSYWRCSLDGGPALQVAVEPKDTGRFTVTLTVTGMSTAAHREAMRPVLKEILSDL